MTTANQAATDPVGAELRLIVRAGATLLPQLAAAVERCRTEPDPGRDLARACGALSSAYNRLIEQLHLLPASPMTERLTLLLTHELRIVEEATLLAFRPHDHRWTALARAFGDGLTASADELLLLAARL